MNAPWNALRPGAMLNRRNQVEEFLAWQPSAIAYRGSDLIPGRTVALHEQIGETGWTERIVLVLSCK